MFGPIQLWSPVIIVVHNNNTRGAKAHVLPACVRACMNERQLTDSSAGVPSGESWKSVSNDTVLVSAKDHACSP